MRRLAFMALAIAVASASLTGAASADAPGGQGTHVVKRQSQNVPNSHRQPRPPHPVAPPHRKPPSK
jgi:hypothetical protein